MFDLLVIGAGPGGYTAAARAAKLGLSTAIVEERSWGGTCLNRGCVPTKTLLHASEVYRSAADGAAIGIHAEGLRADIPEIFAYKERISRQLCGGVESLLKGAGVTLLRGRAVITAPGSIRVTGEDGGDYEARRILIATGSVPVRPPIPGLELAMTSDELLEGADHLYRSIVIIGGGVIGVEFATFYSDLGCSVTLLEGMDRLLPNMDRELGQNLALILKKQGVQVCTRSMVDRLEQTPEGIAVHYTAKETPGCAVGEAVLCAIGRRAFRDGLFAEGLTPETNGHGLWVDEHYQTSIPGVYAIGGCVLPGAAGPCGGSTGGSLRGAHGGAVRRGVHGRRTQLHLLSAGDRRRGTDRGGGQGAGHPRQDRQVRHGRQRPDRDRRPRPVLHEGHGPRRDRGHFGGAADVSQRQRHHRAAGAGHCQRHDTGAAAGRHAAPPHL